MLSEMECRSAYASDFTAINGCKSFDNCPKCHSVIGNAADGMSFEPVFWVVWALSPINERLNVFLEVEGA